MIRRNLGSAYEERGKKELKGNPIGVAVTAMVLSEVDQIRL